jgi:ABC-2 type transport system permease protein
MENRTMKRIISQCIKELAQFRRDRLTVALAFLLPFIALIIFGFAIRLEAKNIPLYVRDFDLTNTSRAYIERLFATNQFVYISTENLPDSILNNPQAVIDRGLAKVSVIIPPDFSRKIKADLNTDLQVLVDGSDVNNARVIKNSIQATTSNFLRVSKLQTTDNKIVTRLRLWFNPGRKESLFIVPGLYGLLLWIFPSLLSAIAMVREKVDGTVLQVYASTLSATEMLLGKLLAYLAIGVIQAIFMMVSGALIWQLSFAGDPTPLFIGTVIFLADAVSFGLLIGTRVADQTSAIQGVALVGFLTALLLSGLIYPLSNIPFPLSLISNIVPARYYIEISRDAYVRGTGWAGIWFGVLVLIVIGLLLFNLARKNLKRMQLSD